VRRVGALDGVRGIAIAAVVGLHAFHWPSDGARGVDIFFVLSGFLITSLLLNEHASKGSIGFRAFYTRRARRLMPALVITIAVYLAVSVATAHRVGHAALASLVAASYTTNLVVGSGHAAVAGALTHTWSLSAEEQFYLLWPALLFLVFRAQRRTAIRVLVITIAAVTVELSALAAWGAASGRLAFAPDTRSLGLAIGCLTALCLSELQRLSRSMRTATSFAVALSIALAGLGLFTARVETYQLGGLTVFCAAVALLIVRATDGSSLTSKALSFVPLAWLGRISYSLYLYHLPIFIAFGVYAGGFATTEMKVVAIALSVLAAALSFRFLEQPFLRRDGRPRPHSPATADPLPFALEPAVAKR
jgi:peptidoglycan/LPS O-acetylase OafA/YrhL